LEKIQLPCASRRESSIPLCSFRIAQTNSCSVLQSLIYKDDHERFTFFPFLLQDVGHWHSHSARFLHIFLFIFTSMERKDIDFCVICGGLRKEIMGMKRGRLLFKKLSSTLMYIFFMIAVQYLACHVPLIRVLYSTPNTQSNSSLKSVSAYTQSFHTSCPVHNIPKTRASRHKSRCFLLYLSHVICAPTRSFFVKLSS
jgi:hypothetical protein